MVKRCVLAVVAAFCASEGILRFFMADPMAHVGVPGELGIGRVDKRLGWRFIPHRRAAAWVTGRTVIYAIDADGNRSVSPDARSNPAAPSIVFLGESIMCGWGLEWEEA